MKLALFRASVAFLGAWALIAACSRGRGTSSGGGSGNAQVPEPPLEAPLAIAYPPDAGTTSFAFGGPGPWPIAPATAFGAAQGFDELPIVDISTDEAQNLWAVSRSALYLWRPGEPRARKYTAADGLYLDNALPPGITAVCGGAPGEAFVGYQGAPVVDPQHDALRFKGKLDRVLLKPDGSLVVIHYDVHNNDVVGLDSKGEVIRIADGGVDPELTDWSFNEDRTVLRFLYDHLYHRGELYVAYTHGVARFRAGDPDPISGADYVDHIHPVVTDATGTPRMGDWNALALDPSTRVDQNKNPSTGALWMGGRWTGGAAAWTPGLYAWGRNELNPFYVAFTSPPVFPVAQGEDVFIYGVAALSDGSVYFGSLIGRGIARWRAREGFRYLSPQSDLGLPSDEIFDLQRLPDDTVLVQQAGAIYRWSPQPEPRGQLSGPVAGIPGSVLRAYVDPMVNPAAVWLATDQGIGLVRMP